MSGWTTIEMGGKPADVFEPSGGKSFGRAVLYLHDHDRATLKDNTAFTAELQNHGLPAVCPHGGRSWWLDRICPEFDGSITPMAHLLNGVVPWISERWNVQPPAIGLIGIGMGGQGALQLAYRHARLFPVVAAISPAVDFHDLHGLGLPLDEMFTSAEAARQETATLNLHPLNWPRHQLIVCDPADADWFEGCERLASKLYSMGIPFESDLETTAGGHDWRYFNAMAPRAIGFVDERLGSEMPRS